VHVDEMASWRARGERVLCGLQTREARAEKPPYNVGMSRPRCQMHRRPSKLVLLVGIWRLQVVVPPFDCVRKAVLDKVMKSGKKTSDVEWARQRFNMHVASALTLPSGIASIR